MSAFAIVRVEAVHAVALAELSQHAEPSVLGGLPFTNASDWTRRIESIPYPQAIGLVALDRRGRALAYLHLQATANRVRLKHVGHITQVLARPDRLGQRALATLLAQALGYARDALVLRRIDIMLDPGSAGMGELLIEHGFAQEAICPGRAAWQGQASPQTLYARIDPEIMPRPPAPALPQLQRPRRRKPGEILIRPAHELDAEDMAAVFASRSAARGTLQHPWTSADVWRGRLEQIAQSPHSRFLLVAEHAYRGQKRLVAHAGLVTVSDDPREKHVASLGIAVHEDWQGLGVGRALMCELLDYALAWGHYHRLELQVFVDNDSAIALYRSLGFVTEGTVHDSALREGGYVDSYLMGRLVATQADED